MVVSLERRIECFQFAASSSHFANEWGHFSYDVGHFSTSACLIMCLSSGRISLAISAKQWNTEKARYFVKNKKNFSQKLFT